MSHPFEVVVNQRTHLAVHSGSGRCLGGVGANFCRNFVFPLYTPRGLTVLREFPFDHPFHNGLFVAQHPVRVAGRQGNLWAAPPLRGPVRTAEGQSWALRPRVVAYDGPLTDQRCRRWRGQSPTI